MRTVDLDSGYVAAYGASPAELARWGTEVDDMELLQSPALVLEMALEEREASARQEMAVAMATQHRPLSMSVAGHAIERTTQYIPNPATEAVNRSFA